MKRSYLLALAVVLAILLWWWWRSGGPRTEGLDLVELFPQAEKRSGMAVEQAFNVGEQEVNGERKRIIFMHPPSRLIYRLSVPQDAWLRAWVALKPEAWDKDGDGVVFRVGVSDGRTYEQFVDQLVDPHGRSGDRRWVPISVDLSAYAGQDVELIFNTDPGPPGSANTANDWAVWGAPAVVVER